MEDMQDLMQKSMIEASVQLAKQRDEQLIKVLKDNGHEFDTMPELHYFIKHRCELKHWSNKNIEMLIDGKVVANWWDTMDIKTDMDNYKVTITCGKPPHHRG